MARFLPVALMVLTLVLGTSAAPKYVSVNLDAKWSSTPILLEASEYLASEGNDNFWGFVSKVTGVEPENLAQETDESMYDLIKKFSRPFLSPLLQDFLKIFLSLRSYSPAVEMFQQMALDAGNPGECDAFVDINGEKTCDPDKISALVKSATERDVPAVFNVDHVYPGSSNTPVVAILYAKLGTSSFKSFHTVLAELGTKKEVTYVLRHYTRVTPKQKTRLSGYGVELAIKSTEYKAKDDTKVEDKEPDHGDDSEAGDEDGSYDELEGFVFSKLRELHPDLKSELKKYQHHLSDSSTELVAFKPWELQDLSLQAAQKIVSSAPEDSLALLRDISQNFPSISRTLVKISVQTDLKKEILKNQQSFENHHGFGAGESLLYLNGIPLDMEAYDVYTMLDIMKSEASLMEGLHSLGFNAADLNRLLLLDMSSGAEEFALDIRHSAVQFINDLESDSKYKSWPSSMQDLLRPSYPGMMRHVAKNLFNLVFIVDPLDKESRELLKMAEAFYVHNVPVRIGLVFKVSSDPAVLGQSDAGVALANAFDYVRQEENPAKGLTFITDVYEAVKTEEISAEDVMSEFSNQFPDEDKDKVFGEGTEYDYVKRSSGDFISRSGLSDFPQVLINGVPMKKKFLTQDDFEEGVITEIMKATSEFQQAAYNNKIHDGTNVLEWLMEKDHVLPRLNSRVLSPPAAVLDLTENMEADIVNDLDTFKMLTGKDMASTMADNMKYLQRNDEESLRAISMWLVCDLQTAQGRDLTYSTIKRLKSSHDLRVGFVFNAESDASAAKVDINKAVMAALKTLSVADAKNFVTKLVKEDNVNSLLSGQSKLEDLAVHDMDVAAYMAEYKKITDDFLKVHRTFAERVLGMSAGQRAIVTNGRVLGPLGEDEEFLPEDVDLLELHIKQQSKKIQTEIKLMGYEGQKGSDLIMKVDGLLSSGSTSHARKVVNFVGDKHSVVKLLSEKDRPAFKVEAIVDPASTAAQKMAPILMALREIANMDITLYMNSREKLSEMPLKNFYRYVLEPELQFKPDGKLSSGPYARFYDMPQKSLLTLGMSPPESWLVEGVRTTYDLDNILLEEVSSNGIQANFDLEYLLLEGHCHDSNTGQPPRGLQFTLGTNTSSVVMDTIVMANLGYFQMKANPGAWILKLRSGRSAELYDIASHEFTDTPVGFKDILVTIGSFKSKTIRVKVARTPGMENEKLLDDSPEQDKGLWGTISSTLSGEKTETDKDQTLNIFSVASGHLYERLLRIMMMSVLKNTKSKVKFWFLKNYLSPTFKDFIPHYAEEYGFEYELVQYKWPKWLNKQNEKQRIIWGYKILFLDVLFPLDVKKIIFVDADQIVRTDLQELHDFDLEGAPYGYTPFCNSRKEMDGFRFWKSGYWSSHLAGRRYHISALYVIDLKRFRQIAAGDRLRGQYQGLSQDPNSLSNLDQDLPNNMIHQVAIKSLPQHWLWCETWCSDESKASAKTIDLCNNPMTKEPKLKAAMRIVPEWKNYDYEIKVFWDTIYGTTTRYQVEYDPPELDPKKKETWRDRIDL